MAINREISQFSNFVSVDDTSKKVSISTSLSITDDFSVSGVSTFNDKVAIGTDVVSNSGKLHFATANGYINRASISVGNPIIDYGLYVVDSTSNANSNLHQNYVRQSTNGNYSVSVGAANAFRVSNNDGSSSSTGNPGGMTDDEVAFVVNPDTSTELRYNYDKKLETTGSGVVVTGILTATSYRGDGSQLTGVLAASEGGISVQDDQSLVGVSTTIDFGTGLSVSPVSAGVVTVTSGASAGISPVIAGMIF